MEISLMNREVFFVTGRRDDDDEGVVDRLFESRGHTEAEGRKEKALAEAKAKRTNKRAGRACD